MTRAFKVAVVGVKDVVGKALIELLVERQFPYSDINPVALQTEVGASVLIDNKAVAVEALDEFDFSGVDIAFFAAGTAIADQYASMAIEGGAVVIDTSPRFSQELDVPFVSKLLPGVGMLEAGFSANVAVMVWPEEMPPKIPPALFDSKPFDVISSRCSVPF